MHVSVCQQCMHFKRKNCSLSVWSSLMFYCEPWYLYNCLFLTSYWKLSCQSKAELVVYLTVQLKLQLRDCNPGGKFKAEFKETNLFIGVHQHYEVRTSNRESEIVSLSRTTMM